ncbi:Ubiquitin specific peptidase 10, partial [Caligus rogercresseyi]
QHSIGKHGTGSDPLLRDSLFQRAHGNAPAFFTLQLDLQSESIRSSFSMESLDGYVCSKTNLEIEASRSLSIDDLPP